MKYSVRPALLILLMFALLACSLPEAPTRTALVYGISIYQTAYGEGDPSSNNLTYTDNDAQDVATLLLRSEQNWDVKTRIINPQNLDTIEAPTRANIENDINSLIGTQGLVLFYYSGHGTVNTSGESQIIPFGAIENTSDRISVKDLYTMFENAELNNVIIILDSCNSGGFVSAGATVDAIPPVFGTYDPVGPVAAEGDIHYTWFINALGDSINGYIAYEQNSGYIVISAAGAGELSWESPSSIYGSGHGIFTYFLLQSQTDPEADFDGDGLITSGEAFAYCAVKINETWNADNSSYYSDGTYADYLPHLSGTPREYALWANE